MGGSLIGSILGGITIYRRSAMFFLALGVVAIIAGLVFKNKLNAVTFDSNTLNFNLSKTGEVYLENAKVPFEQFVTSTTYRYRYQVVNRPTEPIDQLTVVVTLPQSGDEQSIGHRIISNGQVTKTSSELISPLAILFSATGVSPQSQISIEFEVPKSFITQAGSAKVKQFFTKLPAEVWLAISVAMPIITLLTLMLVALKRSHKVVASKTAQTSLPSRLSPAMVGILLRGRLTTRELSSTIFHLAYRGHIIIRQLRREEYRFRRRGNGGALLDYESVLLDQVFGRSGEAATTEEVNLSLSQEVFSKRISQAFVLAYKKINELGYFYTNPLTLHRRYQTAGVAMTVLGIIGLVINILFIDNAYSIFLWGGMIVSAILVFIYSKGMPVRTIYGDRELSKWLSFKNYLSSSEPINYTARGQDLYLAYLPYAIVFECEQEWTRRFYHLPFSSPQWYLADNISTIDKFANSIFPIFGYLSHALYISSEPSSR
ncbi:DUF2207 domain-containing protein [Candidatus Berkelbacteria bacterium]|nr:DUF2207 domain-containing protein [Candidatus Berkelbacteria bacterium]